MPLAVSVSLILSHSCLVFLVQLSLTSSTLTCLLPSSLTVFIIARIIVQVYWQITRIFVLFLADFLHLYSCNSCDRLWTMEKEANYVPLRYKVDILALLKERGYNTNRIRTEGLLSQSTLQKFRKGQGVSWENLETLCYLLDCQPGDLIEYVREDNVQEKGGTIS